MRTLKKSQIKEASGLRANEKKNRKETKRMQKKRQQEFLKKKQVNEERMAKTLNNQDKIQTEDHLSKMQL